MTDACCPGHVNSRYYIILYIGCSVITVLDTIKIRRGIQREGRDTNNYTIFSQLPICANRTLRQLLQWKPDSLHCCLKLTSNQPPIRLILPPNTDLKSTLPCLCLLSPSESYHCSSLDFHSNISTGLLASKFSLLQAK